MRVGSAVREEPPCGVFDQENEMETLLGLPVVIASLLKWNLKADAKPVKKELRSIAHCDELPTLFQFLQKWSSNKRVKIRFQS